jgi:type II secretory pathway pseudopilin PulG
MSETAKQSRLSNIAQILIVGVVVIILAALILPQFRSTRHDYRGKEVKANLHNIQLSIERYAVDNNGIYPSYLIGGDPKYAAKVDTNNTSSKAFAFSNIKECEPLELVSDVLLREGYIDTYPRNPFVRSGVKVHQMQADLPTSLTGNDPLRNDSPGGEKYGTRFGAYCTTMGQVLCDPRFEKWDYTDPSTGAVEEHDTWAIIEYQFWDMWRDPAGKEPYLPFSPGQFFYKSAGSWHAFELEESGELDENQNPIMLPNLPANEHLSKEGETIHPLRLAGVDQYMLGAYGKLRSKGKDVLGEEGTSTSYPPDPYPPFTRLYIPHWTRSQYSNTEKSGSPYSGDLGTDDSIRFGSHNAIPDGIILVLTSGEEYIGD